MTLPFANPPASLPLTGGTLTGNLTIGAHLQYGSTAPSAAAGSNAGGTPPSPVITTGSNDGGGTITFGTGTGPVAGVQVAVTFNTAWTIPGGGGPHIVVNPNNAATQALGIYASGSSPTGFNLSCASNPTASQGNTIYSFNYVVVG